MKNCSTICLIVILIVSIFVPACKSAETQTIVGTWAGDLMFYVNAYFEPTTYVFSGDDVSGFITLTTDLARAEGSYTVTGQTINMTLTWIGDNPATLMASGTINADYNSIEGTFTQNNGYNGTWSCYRPYD